MPASRRPGCRPVAEIAADLAIRPEHVVPYGDDKAKIRLAALTDADRTPGRLILVSAMTPTGAGEGKTTMSIGLAQGLAHLGERACVALREPSLGPTFGLKGGATGGGRSVLVPAADINLHFTGDLHAVTYAHNLLATLLDNHIHHRKEPQIDPRRVTWPRVIDLNDRALRQIVVGLGGVLQGVPREAGFDITPASEIMAVLCLAGGRDELRERLGRLIVGETVDGDALTAGDLQAVGALMVLLKDAIMPNLVQTGEGVPALVHGGPFANIAHGCNSIIATRLGLTYSDWTVTEAGFGFDLGAEKFFDIKSRVAGLDVAAVVLVATVRALKHHGGVDADRLGSPDAEAVERGMDNLRQHVDSARLFGKEPVIAINRFADDTDGEIGAVTAACEDLGVTYAIADVYARGGEGGAELARLVIDAAGRATGPFRPLYDWDSPVTAKMDRIATAMYGAERVEYTPDARQDIARIEALGLAGLPLCVAKTPLSLSGNPRVRGRPRGFELTVRRVLPSAGAGFLVPLVGNIVRMPGLAADPQALRMDLTEDGIAGLVGG
jgi:formate--tetrahydrofolate ligase